MIGAPARAGQYRVIYADPPWRFETYSAKGKGRSAERHYDCMSIADIKALPVSDWAASTAVLYLWTTAPFVMVAGQVIEAWGFSYKTNAVWPKRRQATGYWFAGKHEHLLVAARGSGLAPRYRGIKLVPSIIEGEQREHSRKPDSVYDLIERYHPDDAKLELFARPPLRAGWDAWGNEVSGELAA